MARIASRRSFLKVGLAGAFALAAAGSVYRMRRPADLPARFALDGRSRSVLGALAPVVLKDALGNTPSAVDAAVSRVQEAIAGLPLSTQREIQDLFGLLILTPSRRFLVGLAHDWPQATQAEIADFLNSWRFHRFGMLRSAYQALHDLITGSWYADGSTWAGIGYPGPIKELS